MKQQYQGFMDQFDQARKDLEKMPSWMRESAKVATLTYPVTKSQSTPQVKQEKRKP